MSSLQAGRKNQSPALAVCSLTSTCKRALHCLVLCRLPSAAEGAIDQQDLDWLQPGPCCAKCRQPLGCADIIAVLCFACSIYADVLRQAAASHRHVLVAGLKDLHAQLPCTQSAQRENPTACLPCRTKKVDHDV